MCAAFAAVLAVVALTSHLSTGIDDPKPIPVAEIAGAGSKPSSAASATAEARVDEVKLPDSAGAEAPDGDNGSSASLQADAAERAAAEAPPEADLTMAPPGNPIVRVRGGKRIEMRDAPGGKSVAKLGDETEFHAPTILAVFRQRRGWIGVPTPLLPNGELGWIRADSRKLRSGYVDYSIVVDLSERAAHLRRGARSVRSWTVTVGAPGTETPTGRFAVTDTFRGGLDPAYGCCAVALTASQPNLPSGWLGGDRIAFHGTDGAIGVATSSGCVRSAEEDVRALVDTVPLGTPVRIHE